METIPQLPPLATLALILILPIFGRLLKELRIPRLDREIPTLLPLAGGLLACAVAGWSWQVFLAGMGGGGLAVAGNQRWRQRLYGSGRSRPLADTARLSPEKPWPKTRVSNINPITPPPAPKRKPWHEIDHLCIFALVTLLLLPACKTGPAQVDPASQDQAIRRTVAVVEMGATLGVYYTVKQEPQTRPYFEAAQAVIGTLATSGEYDPSKLTWMLQGITGWQDAYVTIAASVALYESYFADTLDKKLDQSAYCRPVLQALAKGIKLGLAPGQAAERYPEYIRPSASHREHSGS